MIVGHTETCQCRDCRQPIVAHNAKAQFRCDVPGMNVVWLGGKLNCQCRTCVDYKARQQQEIFKSDVWFLREGRPMAGINVCDREGCDAGMKGKATGGIRLYFTEDSNNYNANANGENMELCPACTEDVYNLLHSEPLTPRQAAYKEPFDPTTKKGMGELDGVSTEALMATLMERTMKDKRTAIEGTVGN